MITSSASRRMIVWLATLTPLLVGFVAPVRAGDGERHVVLVNVLDRDGDSVPRLTAANFRGEYRGQSVEVLSAIEDRAPRRVAVLLDRSGSQRGVAQLALRSAEELIDTLTPRHSIVIGTLAESVRQVAKLTNDRQALHDALRDVAASEPTGPSYVYGAVLQACQGLQSPRPVGDAVWLFSDCEDTASAIEPTKMVAAAAQTGVRVFTVPVPSERPPLGVQWGQSWANSLAEATGGTVTRLEDLQKELPTLRSMVTDAYRLEVEFPKAVDKPQKWNLELVGADGKKLPKVRLVYPHLIAPMAQAK